MESTGIFSSRSPPTLLLFWTTDNLVRFANSSLLASVHLPQPYLCNFFFSFLLIGCLKKLLLLVILSAAMMQTSGRETGYLPPCSENSQSFPGWLWTVFCACWLPTDLRWAEKEGIVNLLVAVLENQVQKQGTVCAVFIALFTLKICFLCAH